MITTSALQRSLGYKKFQKEQLSVLVLDTQYHLQKECTRTLQALGHKVFVLAVAGLEPHVVVRQLLQHLVSYRPDFILSINHLGFDNSNHIGNLLEKYEIPIAVWYVDSPFFVLYNSCFPAPHHTSTFLWEKAYLPLMQQCGANDIHYLPLACDLQRFEYLQKPQVVEENMAFVGSCVAYKTTFWRKKLSKKMKILGDSMSEKLLEDPWSLLTFLNWSIQEATEQSRIAVAYATCFATQKRRRLLMQALNKQLPSIDLQLYGEQQWQSFVPEAQWHTSMLYGQDVWHAYQKHAIHLNSSSLQMPSAINQRLFDIPMAYGFALHDKQSSLEELFEVNQEVICYESTEELVDKIQFYHHKPLLREAITNKARQKIIQQHSYLHRIHAMIGVLKKRYQKTTRFAQQPLAFVGE